MVEHLHRGRPLGEISHRVGPGDPLPIGRDGQRRRHLQGVAEEPRLIDGTGEGDRAGGLVERDVEMMGRQVRDAAVQPVPQPAGGVEVGRAVAHEAAAGDELVEAVQPAEAIGLGQGHEPRMDRPVHRGLPAELAVARHHLPDAQPTIGEHEHLGAARHEFDEEHAVAPAAGEPSGADGQRPERDIHAVGGRERGRAVGGDELQGLRCHGASSEGAAGDADRCLIVPGAAGRTG